MAAKGTAVLAQEAAGSIFSWIDLTIGLCGMIGKAWSSSLEDDYNQALKCLEMLRQHAETISYFRTDDSGFSILSKGVCVTFPCCCRRKDPETNPHNKRSASEEDLFLQAVHKATQLSTLVALQDCHAHQHSSFMSLKAMLKGDDIESPWSKIQCIEAVLGKFDLIIELKNHLQTEYHYRQNGSNFAPYLTSSKKPTHATPENTLLVLLPTSAPFAATQNTPTSEEETKDNSPV